jgi:hypothetical protein
MSQRTETAVVRLTAVDPLELEPGIIMAAGTYRGTRQRTGVLLQSGMRWTAPKYEIEFSADQLKAMGVRDIHSSTISETFTVTEFVQSGQIKVN